MSAFSSAWSINSFYPAWRSDPWSSPGTGGGDSCTVDWLVGSTASWLNSGCRDWLDLSDTFTLDTFGETTESLLNTTL